MQTLDTVVIGNTANIMASMDGPVRRMHRLEHVTHLLIPLQLAHTTCRLQATYRRVKVPARQPVPRRERPPVAVNGVVGEHRGPPVRATDDHAKVSERLSPQQPDDRLVVLRRREGTTIRFPLFLVGRRGRDQSCAPCTGSRRAS